MEEATRVVATLVAARRDPGRTMNAASALDASARSLIENTIARVEKVTSAEIVCAIATESGRYGRAESMLGLALAILFLALVDVFFGSRVEEGWSSGQGMMLGVQSAAVAVGFVLGSWLARTAHALRRHLVPARELAEEVARAADHVFALASVGMTSGRTGVLVYVSLFERRVVVLADRRTYDVLGADGVDALRDIALERLRGGDVAGAFTAAVEAAGERLKTRLPADAAANPDEISNKVLVFPGRP